MKSYDPAKMLFSLHVPKCSGQTLRTVLEKWFANNLHFHYFQSQGALPKRYELQPNSCIHGHFNDIKGFGIKDYYPLADQFITFLRDPLEIALSNYFFWKRKARKRQLLRGVIKAGSVHDYKNVDDFFIKRQKSHITNFLPSNLDSNNYKKIFAKYYVYIGIVEDFPRSPQNLAFRLGFEEPEDLTWLNRSSRDEELSKVVRERFIAQNSFAFALYD